MTWPEAVRKMADWYQTNIHTYQGTVSKPRDLSRSLRPCPLLGGAKVCDDCTGYVSACCQMIGALPSGYLLGSGDCSEPNGVFAKHVSKGGFKIMPYSEQAVQPYDIIAVYKKVNGKLQHHAEIYAGNRKSFSWGNIHDVARGGMPSATTWYSYQTIYRHDGVSRDTPGYVDGDYSGGGGGGGGTYIINLEKWVEPYPTHSEYDTYTGKGGNIYEKAKDNAFSEATLSRNVNDENIRNYFSTDNSNYKKAENTRIYSTNDAKIILDELRINLDGLKKDLPEDEDWANKGVDQKVVDEWKKEQEEAKKKAEEEKKKAEEEAKKKAEEEAKKNAEGNTDTSTNNNSKDKDKDKNSKGKDSKDKNSKGKDSKDSKNKK